MHSARSFKVLRSLRWRREGSTVQLTFDALGRVNGVNVVTAVVGIVVNCSANKVLYLTAIFCLLIFLGKRYYIPNNCYSNANNALERMAILVGQTL